MENNSFKGGMYIIAALVFWGLNWWPQLVTALGIWLLLVFFNFVVELNKGNKNAAK